MGGRRRRRPARDHHEGHPPGGGRLPPGVPPRRGRGHGQGGAFRSTGPGAGRHLPRRPRNRGHGSPEPRPDRREALRSRYRPGVHEAGENRPPGRGLLRQDHDRLNMPAPVAAVEARGLYHIYREREVETVALRGAEVVLPRGTWTSLMGPSGSGKSTLVHVLGGLLEPSGGSVLIDGEDITGL